MAQIRPVLHLCLKWGWKIGSVPVYSGILEQFYFFKSKKNLWHSWHTLFLAYKCWYKRIIVCHGCWHSLAQLLVLLAFCNFALAHSATRRARPFFYFRKLFCPKISLYSIRLIWDVWKNLNTNLLLLRRRDITSTKLRGWISRVIAGTQIYIQQKVLCHQKWLRTHIY